LHGTTSSIVVGGLATQFAFHEEAATVFDQYGLRPIMKQGTAASLPETWTHDATVEDAREGAKLMYHNDRVLRVMMVTDSVGSFVEWIDR
jgi:hypothetical protein